jgi:preprotein translocase subunit SecD
VAVVVIALATLIVGNEPVLGLDLQGGISVRLFPAGKFSSSSLDTAKNIIDRRVNGLGCPTPKSARGQQHRHRSPGREGRDKAKRLVGRTAELNFRPVLAELPAEAQGSARRQREGRVAACDANAIPNPQALPNTAAAADKPDAAWSCPAASRSNGQFGISSVPPRSPAKTPRARSRVSSKARATASTSR